MKIWKVLFLILLPLSAVAKIEILHPQFFEGWKFDSSYQADGSELKTLQKVNIQCKNKTLVPTHPQQGTKAYHLALLGRYRSPLVRGGENGPYGEICEIWTKHSNPGQRVCLQAKSVHVVVLSDIYQDTCGNIYRGYFMKQFFSSDESMGTLVSLGKTIYENPYSEFVGTNLMETYVGGTYPVQASQFLYFSRISSQDLKSIQDNLKSAQENGQFRNPETGLFNAATPKKSQYRK